jgi:Short C-terminal domain
MDCFCGCGTRISRRLVEPNLLAGQMALELLVWDKARAERRLGPEASELDSMIARGENAYERLLLLLHGDGRETTVGEVEAWMNEAERERFGRADMTDRGGLVTRPKLILAEPDYARLDRIRPGRSFSGTPTEAEAPREGTAAEQAPREPAADGPAAAVDVAGQLERLGALHAEGVLSDEEFAAAKSRVVGL